MPVKFKTNSEVMASELNREQIGMLVTKYLCLACTVGAGRPCGRPFSLKCISGYDEWLGATANPENWKNIRDALGIVPDETNGSLLK